MAGGVHPPIEVIATWPLNYTEYTTGGYYIIFIVCILLCLAYIAVVARVYARVYISRAFGIDDVIIVANMIPLTGLIVGTVLCMTRYGFDRHVWNVPTPTLVSARKITIINEALYMVSTSMTKISILLFYRRLQKGTLSTCFLYCVYAAIASVILYFCTFTGILFAICRPISTFWKMADWAWAATNEANIHCLPEDKILIASAVICAVQDLAACGLPMILLKRLKMPRRQKIALGSVFCIGLFLSICAVVRIVYIYRAYNLSYDMTWESQPAWLWLCVEAEVAIVCASAPALKVYFHRLLVGTGRGSSGKGLDRSGGTGGTGAMGSTHRNLREHGMEAFGGGGIKKQVEVCVDSEERLAAFSPGPWDEPPQYEKFSQREGGDRAGVDVDVELEEVYLPVPRYGGLEARAGLAGSGCGTDRVREKTVLPAETFYEDEDSVEELLDCVAGAGREGRCCV